MHEPSDACGDAFNGSRAATIASGTTGLSEADRTQFLDRMCGNDVELRREVEMLLREQSGGTVQTSMLRGAAGLAAFSLPEEVLPIELERYRLEARIGEGSFGVVYRAMQKAPIRRQVAVKVLHPGLNSVQVLKRFDIERQALAMLQHHHIARLHDAGNMPDGRPFFAMEFIDGVSITQYCDQHKLDIRKRLALFMQVCHAVQHVHQKGIIHRDLKPTNILVVEEEGQPVPKVLDFGIAKATQGELTELTMHTQMQQFMGTPDYMSPEQAQLSALDVDTRSDIYSLGVVLYELMTGRRPFDAKALMSKGVDELRRAIREDEPTRPSTSLRKLSGEQQTAIAKSRGTEAARLPKAILGDLDSIIAKCLEKDRARRYQTANDLARDIERHLENEPVEARPANSWYRFRKFIRRHHATAATLVAVLVAASCAAGLYLHDIHAERQKTLIVLAEKEAQRRIAVSRQLAAQALNAAETRFDLALLLSLEALNQDVNIESKGSLLSLLQNAPLPTAFLPDSQSPLRSIAFSRDGRTLVTAGDQGRIVLWDVASRRQRGLPFSGPGGIIRDVAFGADDKLLAAGADDGGVIVWDLGVDPPRNQHLETGQGSRIAMSQDGRRMAVGNRAGIVSLWELVNGAFQEIERTDSLPGAPVHSLAFSHDGQALAVGVWGPNWSSPVFFWDLNNGLRHSPRQLMGHANAVETLAFTPDDKILASGSLDESIILWDVASGALLKQLSHQYGIVHALTFLPGGQILVSGHRKRSIVRWDVEGARQIPHVWIGNNCDVNCLALSPDGRLLASGGADGQTILWDSPNGDPTSGLARDLEGHVQLDHVQDGTVVFGPDGTLFSAGNFDSQIRMWDVERTTPTAQVLDSRPKARFLAVSPNGQYLAAGGTGGTTLWDLRTRSVIRQFEEGGELAPVAFTPDSQALVIGSNNGPSTSSSPAVVVRDVKSGEMLGAVDLQIQFPLCLAFSPDGTVLACGTGEGKMALWDMRNHRLLPPPFDTHVTELLSIAFSPDGHTLAWAGKSDKRQIYFWDWKTATQIDPPLEGHLGNWIFSLAFSPDGSVLASSSSEIILWDVRSHRQIGSAISGHPPINYVAFSPDGLKLAAWEGLGDVTLIDVSLKSWRARAQAIANRSLSVNERQYYLNSAKGP